MTTAILHITWCLLAVGALAGCQRQLTHEASQVADPQQAEDAATSHVSATIDSAIDSANDSANDVDPALIQQVSFSVPDMMCEFSCAPKVKEVLSQQPGVVQVEVDLPSKTAWVKADKTKFDANAAVAALIDVQFDATTVIP